MLHGGTSLEVFKAWAGDARNTVLLPSHQVGGSLGQRLMSGQTKGVQIDSSTRMDVRCKVRARSTALGCTVFSGCCRCTCLLCAFTSACSASKLLCRLRGDG